VSNPNNPFNQGDPPPQQPQGLRIFSARVPEKVGKAFIARQVIHDSPKEFVIDFLQV